MGTSFSATELLRDASMVFDAADRQPVTITKHGRDRYVMMTTEQFERLKNEDPRRAVSLDTMTPADAAEILAAAADHFAARDRGE